MTHLLTSRDIRRLEGGTKNILLRREYNRQIRLRRLLRGGGIFDYFKSDNEFTVTTEMNALMEKIGDDFLAGYIDPADGETLVNVSKRALALPLLRDVYRGEKADDGLLEDLLDELERTLTEQGESWSSWAARKGMEVVGVAGAAVLAKEAMKWMVADTAPEPEDPNPTQYTWQPIPDPGYGFGGGFAGGALTPEEDYAAFYLVREMRERNNDDALRLERAIERAGSVEAFLKNDLYNPERQMLGKEQEAWLKNTLQSSKARGASWQILGQQVLMGKLNIPVIPPEQAAKLELSEFARPRFEQAQQLAPYGLPSNLDAWDGYPAARERLFAMLNAHATNPISLAGDTHNGWAFNLTNAQSEAVGVEWGTPGVSSPGLENYVPLPPEQMQALLKGASHELVACDTSQRGWTEVTLTPEAATAQWRFVSSVIEPGYTSLAGPKLVATAGHRRLQT